jgi:tetratricopeptide (TPR) repeat protein
MKLRSLVILLAVAGTARADVWQRAIDPQTDPAKDPYAIAMQAGDEHVLIANAENAARSVIKTQIDKAIESYKKAAAAKPTAAEPYARIANVLTAFHIESCVDEPQFNLRASPLRDCTTPNAPLDVAIVEQTLAAWDEFEARAPLDPRFSTVGETSLLFERAILHTKIATRPHLDKAIIEYQKLLDRSSSVDNSNVSRTWGNLAETYMMVGKLETAIDAYREAVKYGGDTSTWYGLAVALDRNDNPGKAFSIIRAQGGDPIGAREAFLHFQRSVRLGNSFFVPEGEVYYYFALVEEALGQLDASIAHWKAYLRSGAHPQFQPRAKAHLDALLVKKPTWKPPPFDPFENL